MPRPRRFAIKIEVDDDLQRALDLRYDAPPGMRLTRATTRDVIKGVLDVALAEILLEHRKRQRHGARRGGARP